MRALEAMKQIMDVLLALEPGVRGKVLRLAETIIELSDEVAQDKPEKVRKVLFTQKEVIARFHTSSMMLRRAERSGQLKSKRKGNKKFYDPSDVAQFLGREAA